MHINEIEIPEATRQALRVLKSRADAYERDAWAMHRTLSEIMALAGDDRLSQSVRMSSIRVKAKIAMTVNLQPRRRTIRDAVSAWWTTMWANLRAR